MSAKRTERLLNLTICLLAARRFLTKEQIRRAVADYAECRTEDAFERMFERDKDELRELGIPLETGTQEAFFSDEVGYRIDRNAYALPEVEFTPEELAVLGLAARAWQQASISHAAGTALLKLRAAGVDPDESAIVGLAARAGDTEPAFLPLYTAVWAARPVAFEYRTPAGDAPLGRRVEPWGVLNRNGHWYLVGQDTERGAPRVFRLSRITGEVRTTGPAGSVVKPEGTDIRGHLARMVPAEERRSALVRARPGEAIGLRRRATVVAPGPESEAGWDTLDLGYWHLDTLVEELVAYGPAVLAVSPPEVRTAVRDRLRALAGLS